MKWWLYTVIPGGGAGNVLATLSTWASRSQAQRIGQAVASQLNLRIVMVRARSRRDADRALDVAPVQGQAVMANPAHAHRTLVEAGYAQAARYHLLSGRGAPLADLYVGPEWSRKVAQLFTNFYGEPVQLVEHQGWRRSLADEPRVNPSVPLAVGQRRSTNPKRRNPGPLEVGDSVTVLDERYPIRSGVVEKVSRDYVYVRLGADLVKFPPELVARANPSRSKSAQARRRALRDPGSRGRRVRKAVTAHERTRAEYYYQASRARDRRRIQSAPGHYPDAWLKPNPKRRNAGGPRIVYNRLLGGWYVVVGPHQTPLNGRFNSKAEAQAWLAGGRRANPSRSPAARARRRGVVSHRQRRAIRKAQRAGVDRSPQARYQIVSQIRRGTKRGLPHGRSNPVGDAFKPGDRVQLHAATDEWMQGDRYGVVVGLGRTREYTDRFSPGGIVKARPVRVKLDKSGRVRRFHPDNLFLLEQNPRTPSGGAMSYPEAVRWLGEDHVAWIVKAGPNEIRNRMWGAWTANLLDTQEAYDAVLRHHFAAEHAADLEASRRSFAESIKGRSPNPKRHPRNAKGAVFTIREAAADVLASDGFHALADEVMKGADIERALETAIPLARWKAHLGRALELARASRGRWDERVNPRARRPRSNPFGEPASEREQAEKFFRTWHEYDTTRTKRVRVPHTRMPKHVVQLGEVVRIDYISPKWEGKRVTYTHQTKRPYPLLVSSPDAAQLYLVGGKMKPTADGLVN